MLNKKVSPLVRELAGPIRGRCHWQIGTRVLVDILSQGWAEYGKQIVAALGRQLGLDAL
jgi:hypothetical protein